MGETTGQLTFYKVRLLKHSFNNQKTITRLDVETMQLFNHTPLQTNEKGLPLG